jgi:uncharacterized protein YdhG (YjbR/CyaY superfamily)
MHGGSVDNKIQALRTIDEYIMGFPPDIQQKLQEIRAVIRETAPEATEKISYQMPTFYLKGNLVHFAAFNDHLSLFPAPSGVEKFMAELGDYKTSKGTIQFPIDQPVPLDLVKRITAFRVEENRNKATSKKK